MPNSNYVKGRAKEYKIVNFYKSKGYDIAQRTAGSHSPVDVIVVSKKKKKIIFVQAKPDSLSQKNKLELEKENDWLNDEFIVSFEVI